MTTSVHQIVWDSEEDYINETFWRIQPLFILVMNGQTEELRNTLDLQLDRYDFHQRITRDEQKQREYMAVSLVNTFMIAGIQGGVYPPEANWIADRALRRLLAIQKPEEMPFIIRDAAIQLSEKVKEAKRSDTGNPHVEQAKHYMLTHMTQVITAAQIAEHVGISQYHLSRLFKSLTGKSMMDYLTDQRIGAAKQLLATSDQPIQEIAALLRFCDQSHMTYAFRKRTGMTPKQYRDAAQSKYKS